jgi:hypothetical protein
MGEQATTIKVVIGFFECRYHAYRTFAEPSYDGFGTFTIYETDVLDERDKDKPLAERRTRKERAVLIAETHLQWQLSRYGSGLCGTEPLDVPENWLVDKLVRRVRGIEEDD